MDYLFKPVSESNCFLADPGGGFPDVSAARRNSNFYIRFGKRTFDVVVSVNLLLIALPLILLCAAIVATDGGRPFFRQGRIGRNGRVFWCFKIRTMVVNAEALLASLLVIDAAAALEWATGHKLRRDPRTTQLGRLLRRSSLDELPQLWNVLRGDMSLVGPRPVTRDELVLYGPALDAYYNLRPGLTGLWQVSGRNNVTFAERVECDRAYGDCLSLWTDLRILLRTVPAVLRGTGC